MIPQIPRGTRAERLAFARRWIRDQQITGSSVRLSRARRRLLVAVMYSVFVGSPFLLLAFLSSNTPLPLILLFAWSVLWLLVTLTVPSSQKRKRSELDERERAERDNATSRAYWVIAAVVFLSFMYSVTASTTRFGLPFPSNTNQVLAIVSPFLWVIVTLPTAILAWTIPDPATEL